MPQSNDKEVYYQQQLRKQPFRSLATGEGDSPKEGLEDYVIEPARRRARINAEKAASFGKGPVAKGT